MTQNRFWSAVAVGFTVLSATVLLSQTAAPPQAEAFKSEEYLLLGSPNRGAGEPMVFVNPKDSNNLIVVAMATLNHLPSGEGPLPRGGPGAGGRGTPNPAVAAIRVRELSTPDGSRTDIAVTHDGGKTWEFTEDNFRKVFNMNRCSDSFAGSGPDGTLYVGCLAYLYRGDAAFLGGFVPTNGEAVNPGGGTAIAWSTDKGKTWSEPKWVHPLRSPELYAPGVHPVADQVAPVDRPYFAADAQTGTIYVSGTGPAYTVDPATPRGRTFIRASHDQARTWGVIYPMDSEDFQGGRGAFSAAHGFLAVAFGATKVPASLNAQCPCTVFGTSKDDGKTFHYQLVPELPAEPAPAAGGRGGGGGFGGGAMLAADETKEGRYALARQSRDKIMISLTEDGGKTWLPPVLAAQLPAGATFGHRAMKYSATTGTLALIWKATYADQTYDMWSSASLDGGRSFKTVRVSHAVSPAKNLERGNFGFGDDLATVDVDDQNVHLVWGDNRAGFLGTWYGRVPLSAY